MRNSQPTEPEPIDGFDSHLDKAATFAEKASLPAEDLPRPASQPPGEPGRISRLQACGVR